MGSFRGLDSSREGEKADRIYVGGTKKWGPRLGTESPGRRVPLLASFSHQRVGSSILASLSEAGGNDLQKVTSKPLPPRLSLFTSRHVERAHACPIARPAPMYFPG